jgi:hypothetical protein
MASPRKLILSIFLVIFIVAGASVMADTIVRGFKSKTLLQPGWIVSLSKNDLDSVELAPATDSSRIYGVVIDPSQAPVTLQSQQGQRVFVATSGKYSVFVNVQHGPINTGDYISMSGNDGIGAKASNDQANVLGQALQKFDGQSGVLSGGGQSAVGKITVAVAPNKNPLVKDEVALPGTLRRAAQSVSNRDVSVLRVYAALVVFLITAAIATVILVTGVRSGMVAIGRNPLSRQHVITGLLQVVVVAVVVFIIGVFAVYLLLKL